MVHPDNIVPLSRNLLSHKGISSHVVSIPMCEGDDTFSRDRLVSRISVILQFNSAPATIVSDLQINWVTFGPFDGPVVL